MFNSLGALKNHIYCNHAWTFELFPKASFGTSNDFVCELCMCTLRFNECRSIFIQEFETLQCETCGNEFTVFGIM